MATRIPLDEWDQVVEELTEFGDPGEATVDDDRVRVDFESAHVEVTREGQIHTGMPLHDFERTGGADLVIDHDSGELTIESDDVAYTFRRPGDRS